MKEQLGLSFKELTDEVNERISTSEGAFLIKDEKLEAKLEELEKEIEDNYKDISSRVK